MFFSASHSGRRTFHEDADGVGTAMSYGVRNSMAAYMSLSGALEGGSQKRKNRNKKSKSVLVPSWDYDPDDV